MYGILRIAIGGISGIVFIAFLYSHMKRTHLLVSAITISIALITASGFIPFENVFYKFKSPEEVYCYYHFGETSVDGVVEGKCSDFVVGTKNDITTYLIVPKTQDGWRVETGLHTKRKFQKLSNGIAVNVYQYKDTSDFFITILDTNGGESTVSDEYNTEFFSLERRNDSLGKIFVTHYAHITNLNPQYSVIVNGNKIVLRSDV